MANASELLERVTAQKRQLLYGCRWSDEDAQRIVPELTAALSDKDPSNVQEALRCLFTIGTHAVSAASRVGVLIDNPDALTRQLAVLALGQIAHKNPELCLERVTQALSYSDCQQDALRILRFLGRNAKASLPQVISCYSSDDPKTRKLSIAAAVSIDSAADETQLLIARASTDVRKEVRIEAEKARKGHASL